MYISFKINRKSQLFVFLFIFKVFAVDLSLTNLINIYNKKLIKYLKEKIED